MARSLSELSIEEIRERFTRSDQLVTPQLLNKLKRDPRQGVRRPPEVLKRRHGKERAERLRLDAMLNFERVLWKSGVQHVAGVDEAGTGPPPPPLGQPGSSSRRERQPDSAGAGERRTSDLSAGFDCATVKSGS